MELVVEQTQQVTSHEVSVSTGGVEELKRKVKIKGEKKEALLTLKQKPEHQSDTKVFTMTMEILLDLTSNKLLVDSILQAGNPVKGILLKLNLPNHRSILTDSKIHIKMEMEGKKRKQSTEETSSSLKSLKVTIKQKQVVEEQKDEKKDDETGSLEFRTEKTQTPIPTPPRSPRIILSSDKNINQELTVIVSPSTTTLSKDPHKKRHISNSNVHNNVIQVHPIITTLTDTTSSADLQKQLYLKMKRSLQDQANDIVLWEVLKRKFEKSSTSNTSCRDDDFHSHGHDDHQEDDASHEGEKRVKRHKMFKSSKSARGSSSNNQPKNPQLMYLRNNSNNRNRMYGLRKQLLMKMRMEDTLNDMLSNQFRNAEENPNEPPRYLYNKDLFFLKNRNTKEKKYVLSLHKIHAEPFPKAGLEEMMNRWVRKEFRNFKEDA
ncbi:hypothetical protein Tco_1289931 [Tanacetum coccineum]